MAIPDQAHSSLVSMERRALARLQTPLAISESGYHGLVQALQTRDAPALRNTRTAVQRGTVAVIPVSGALSTKSDWFSALFGTSSYESIAKDFQAALEDDEIRSVVLDVNSPGGDATGCGELSGLIYAARGKKPIYAYCAGDMCSAAYWIASAADKIVTDASGLIGSIGVRSAMVDSSAYMEKLGIKEYPIVSSQSPHKVLDASKESDRERMVTMVSAIADVFIADVARNRGVTASAVERDFGKGDVLVGAAAVRNGLADEVGDLDSLVTQLNQESPPPRASARRGTAMVKEKILAAADDDTECSGCSSKMGAKSAKYCKKCLDDAGDTDTDDDEDAKATKAFNASVLALLGETDSANAIGALLSLKALAAESAKLKAEVAAIKKEKDGVELKALLDQATVAGKIMPAGRIEMEKLALEAGVDIVRRVLAATKGSAEPASAQALTAPQSAEQAASATILASSAPTLDSNTAEILERLGVSPEKFAKNKAAYHAAAAHSKVEAK